mgnify:CR=1 FL=1|tara:strand:- start:232 stop:723 length:492 start_codon:yes stop_codon:yes gene_type:complete
MTKVKHRAVYTSHNGWGPKSDHKVYDYNDGVDITKNMFYDTYIVNVPCYKVEDVTLAMYGDKKNYLLTNPTTKDIIKIQTSNHKGKQHQYVLATPEFDTFVKQQATFGAIKGHNTKMPKKHLKVVNVMNRGDIGHNRIKVDLYVQDKSFSEYITEQCLKNITA